MLAASTTPYPVTATFTAATVSSSNTDFTYTGSTSSPAQNLTVSASVSTEPTTTSLNAVTSPITYGSETTETFTGSVNGLSGDGNPEGTVTVYYGTPTATQLCTSNLTASGANAATFSCALTASQLTVGTYASVDAVFAPAGTSSTDTNFTYTGSTSSPTQSFSVNPASENTTTSLSALTSPITFGNETTETFSGTVNGQSGGGNPEGTVSVSYGTPTATQLCTSNLTASGANAATFSCALTASQLNVGTYSNVVAVFTPATASSSNLDFTYTGSTSSPARASA